MSVPYGLRATLVLGGEPGVEPSVGEPTRVVDSNGDSNVTASSQPCRAPRTL